MEKPEKSEAFKSNMHKVPRLVYDIFYIFYTAKQKKNNHTQNFSSRCKNTFHNPKLNSHLMMTCMIFHLTFRFFFLSAGTGWPSSCGLIASRHGEAKVLWTKMRPIWLVLHQMTFKKMFICSTRNVSSVPKQRGLVTKPLLHTYTSLKLPVHPGKVLKVYYTWIYLQIERIKGARPHFK